MKEKEICCFNRIYSALEGLQEAHTLAYRALAVGEGVVLEMGEKYDGWEDGQTVFCPGLPEERAGTLLRWFYENGAVKAERSFADGVLNGAVKMYGADGRIFREFNYKKGVKNGAAREYYPDGQLSKEAEYIGGKIYGKARKR